MKKVVALALLALFALPAMPAMAQQPATGDATIGTAGGQGLFSIPGGSAGIAIGVGIGLGLIIIGAARGIGSIGSHAVDSIARQPEAGGRIFTSMIISAALIEGATLFAVVVALLMALNVGA
jgi:F-type H+-transporting ATPase subunit c